MSPLKTGFIISVLFHCLLVVAFALHWDSKKVSIHNQAISLNFSQFSNPNPQATSHKEQRKKERISKPKPQKFHHKPKPIKEIPKVAIIQKPQETREIKEAQENTQEEIQEETQEEISLDESSAESNNEFEDSANANAGGGANTLNEDDPLFALIKSIIDKHNDYPKRAYKLGIEGFVIVEFILFNNGEISEISIANSAHKHLIQGAKDAIIRSYKEFPRLQQNRKIKMKLTYNIDTI